MGIMNAIGRLISRDPGGDGLTEEVVLHGRSVALRLTPAARGALGRRSQPLTVELELFFSCLIRTRVRFPEEDQPDADEAGQPAAEGRLHLRFRPVMSRHCSLEEGHQLTGFPLAEPGPFVPHWVTIDHHPTAGWTGEFGYASSDQQQGGAA